MDKGESVLKIFPARIRNILLQASLKPDFLQEIRLRVGKPLICLYEGKEYFLSAGGKLCRDGESGLTVSREELMETVSYVSRYSLYAFDEELKQGYITIPGGHRVGIAGKIVMDESRIRCVKYISFLNVRLSHERKGCADTVFPYLIREGRFCHTLIISPPKCGKTTLLRDIIRMASNGGGGLPGQNVGVVDERSEIGGSYRGIPQNDLGIRTDVLDCCPKAEGMMMLIRSMAPDIVAVDEIGDYRDSQAIEAVFHCGCKLLATVHGSSVDDIKKKPLLQNLVQYHCFERYIVLDHEKSAGHVRDIFDERGTKLDSR
ncbi:MAG: stage III sporulation protein AA [Lachnospiraceae bacterium]|nr:stage III sporulation protein AA [Lachnospiraceae bacterium]